MQDEHYLELYLALRARLNGFAMHHGLSHSDLVNMTAEDVMTWLEAGGATDLERWSALDRRISVLEVAAKPADAHAPGDAADPR